MREWVNVPSVLIVQCFAVAVFMSACDERKPRPPTTPQKWLSSERPWEIVPCDGAVEDRLPKEFAEFIRREFPFNPQYDWTRLAKDPKGLTGAERQRVLLARLVRLSDDYLVVDVLRWLPRPAKKLSHKRASCTARYRVARTPELDELFDAGSMVEKYGFTFKGIGQGSTAPRRGFRNEDSPVDDVTRMLGKPDYARNYQLTLMAGYYYEKDNLHVFCWGGRVVYVERGRPRSLTSESGGYLWWSLKKEAPTNGQEEEDN